jgi:hypothetical protein
VAGATEQIEVVVLRDEEDVTAVRGTEARARRSVPSRMLQVATTVLVLLAVLAQPVPVGPPVEHAGGPAPRSSEGPCPGPAGRRLWCSFIDDPVCCPAAGPGPSPVAVPSEAGPT